MKSLPAIPYLTLVAQFAYANKMRFWTYNDMVLAIEKYNEYAKTNN